MSIIENPKGVKSFKSFLMFLDPVLLSASVGHNYFTNLFY